jgi:hypothetical protein
MLVRLFYVSTAVGPQTTTVTGSLLEHSRKKNQAEGVTGILCQGKGLYLQVLEGPRPAVNATYQRITADTRHKRIELLSYAHITERQYGHWSMALVDLSASDPMVLMNHTDFDPYAADDVAMARNLRDLLASRTEITGGV